VSSLRLWSDAPVLRAPFRTGKKFGMAEAFLYAGPFGDYLVELLPSINVRYREVYHGIIRVLSRLLYHSFSEINAPIYQRELNIAFAASEVKFPVFFQQFTHHDISHSWGVNGSLMLLSSRVNWGMLGAERFHTYLKSLGSHSRKQVDVSITLNYRMTIGMEIYRCLHPDLFELPPLGSSLYSSLTEVIVSSYSIAVILIYVDVFCV